MSTRMFKRKLFGVAGLSLIGSMLAGCNGFTQPMMPQDNLEGRRMVMSGLPLPGVFIGSAVQWNEDYAVTADHNPLVVGVKHRCSTGCDMAFIKRKARGPVPEWRNAVPGEDVITAGSSMAYFPVYGKGKAADTKMTMTNMYAPNGLSTHSAPVAMGMSGGPVYGADGSVLGITLGNNSGRARFWGEQGQYSAAHLPRISLYLPYSEIQAEWDIFQRIQDGEYIPMIPRPGRALTPEEVAAEHALAVERMENKKRKDEIKAEKKAKKAEKRALKEHQNKSQ